MARFRPEGGSSENTTPFGGFMEAAIVDFTDRSNEFDWAEVFIDVTMKTPASQYPVIYSLKGNFDKEDDGKIKSCTLLNRIYYLFDTIGCKGGPNVMGEFEDENGNKIDNLQAYLNTNFVNPDSLNQENYPYHIFVYKEWVAKSNKAFTRVCPKLVMNTDKGIADLKSYVAFLKQKNLIKEWNGVAPNSVTGDSQAEQSVHF